VRHLVAVECGLVIAVLCFQFPSWWAARWVQDDAYVSFRYARNLVRGHGLVYNVGEPVEGYTNFLWTVLAAIPLARGALDPLPFMHVVAAACWIGAYALLLWLCVRLARDGLWAAPLALLPLALHWSYNMWFFSGMETPLVSLLSIVAVSCVTLDPARYRWALGAASLAGVGLMMTRPDGVVIVAALGLAVALLDGGWIARERRWGRAILVPALPILLIFLPYQLWRLWFYGSLLPNTYYAKVAYLTYYRRGWTYAHSYVDIYALSWFLPAAVLGAGMARPGAARRFLIAAVLSTAGGVFYVVRLGGDFMEWRFLTPISGVFYPALVVGAAVVGECLAAAVRRGNQAPLGGWLVGACVAAALTLVTSRAAEVAQERHMPDQETIPLLRRYADEGRFDWRAAGATFDAVLPPDARIATTSAGIIPYFCDRPCLDLHGLTDPVIARMRVDPNKRGRMGHEHWLADLAEIRRRGVDVVLEWVAPTTSPRAAVTPPGDHGELMSVRMPDDRYVDFTVLDPNLAVRLRDDSRVVPFDPSKISDRHQTYALRRRYGGFTIVDSLDWGETVSEIAHGFRAWSGADAEVTRRTKRLAYRKPDDEILLIDDGRAVHGAAWLVYDVDPGKDLVIVGRFVHSGAAIYDVEVNGQPTQRGLGMSRRPSEVWGESAVRIPTAFLRAGTNEVSIIRRADSSQQAAQEAPGWYFMWFLQR
jgi:arabinofuranosyltransferase